MTTPDDIPLEPPSSETEGPNLPADDQPRRRKIGPESEVRGGPEAAEDGVEDAKPEASHSVRR